MPRVVVKRRTGRKQKQKKKNEDKEEVVEKSGADVLRRKKLYHKAKEVSLWAVDDTLCLQGHPIIRERWDKISAGDEGFNQQRVFFSDFVSQYTADSKTKWITRILMLTQSHVYFLTDDYKYCVRAFKIANIVGISSSETNHEFVIHVPTEYDEHLKTLNKKRICMVIKAIISYSNKNIPIFIVSKDHLLDKTVTKSQVGIQCREGVLRRAISFGDDNELKIRRLMVRPTNRMTKYFENSEKQPSVRLTDFEFVRIFRYLERGVVVVIIRQRETKDIYTLKICTKHSLIKRWKEDLADAQEKEIKAMQHPFLLPIVYAFKSRTHFYFIFRYDPDTREKNELFFRLIHCQNIKINIIKFWIASLSLALSHLHRVNLVYNHLRPENIIIDKNYRCILVDPTLTEERSDILSVYYQDPEHFDDEEINQAVDWYSLGILFYELIVGTVPFYNKDIPAEYPDDYQTHIREHLKKQMKNNKILFRQGTSEECKHLILGLLNPDIKARFNIDMIKSHPFFNETNWKKMLISENLSDMLNKQMSNLRGQSPISKFKSNFPRITCPIYVVGGWDGTNTLQGGEFFDPKHQQWNFLPAMSVQRFALAVACMNKKVIACGGWNGVHTWSTCESFDPITFKWTKFTPMQCKRYGLALVVHNNILYAIGGSDGRHDLDSAEYYDMKLGAWYYLSPMKQKRRYAACAVLKDKIYVAGGRNGDTFLNSVECYDLKTKEWNSLPSMKCSRSSFGLVALGNKLMAFGGSNEHTSLKSVEYYSSTKGKWTMTTSMITERSQLAYTINTTKYNEQLLEDSERQEKVHLGKKAVRLRLSTVVPKDPIMIFALGGFDGRNINKNCEMYNIYMHHWTEILPLKLPHEWAAACVMHMQPSKKIFEEKKIPALETIQTEDSMSDYTSLRIVSSSDDYGDSNNEDDDNDCASPNENSSLCTRDHHMRTPKQLVKRSVKIGKQALLDSPEILQRRISSDHGSSDDSRISVSMSAVSPSDDSQNLPFNFKRTRSIKETPGTV